MGSSLFRHFFCFFSVSIQSGTSDPEALITLAMLRSDPASASVKKVTAVPAQGKSRVRVSDSGFYVQGRMPKGEGGR